MSTAEAKPRSAESATLPTRWDWLTRGFRKYATRYVRKHFHAVRLSRTSAPVPTGDAPLLVVLNHPSWWDPLLCFVLSHQFPDGREHYAAIDAAAVEKYRFFTRLGFFGVDTSSLRGAAEFLRTTSGDPVRAEPDRLGDGPGAVHGRAGAAARPAIGGRPRRRPARPRGDPAARLEYTFWTERTPEALARFGTPIDVGEASRPVRQRLDAAIEDALTETLDGLNAEAMTRDPGRFTTLLDGKTGVGGVYDLVAADQVLGRAASGSTPPTGADRDGASADHPCPRGAARSPVPAERQALPHPRLRSSLAHRPRISVLIPARNEEWSIGPAVESVLANVGVELEVVVLDDHSADRTAEVVREIAARDARVRLEPAPPLPEGWCGKQCACYTLSKHARYPVLTFFDADVRLAPCALPGCTASCAQSAPARQRLPAAGDGDAARKAGHPAHQLAAARLPADRADAVEPRSPDSASGAGSGS